MHDPLERVERETVDRGGLVTQAQFLAGLAVEDEEAPRPIPETVRPPQARGLSPDARRRFVKRLEKDRSPIAEEALHQIAEIYAAGKSVRGMAPEARLAARRELAAPIIITFRPCFRPWLEAQLSRIPRSSKLAEDIRYTLARWPGLTRFLEDDRLELDTNPVENQIRKIALTRKNALFAGHEDGAEKRTGYCSPA